jgi:hypothetical protein
MDVDFVQFGAELLHPSLVLPSQLSLNWVAACLLQTTQHPQHCLLDLLHRPLIACLHRKQNCLKVK